MLTLRQKLDEARDAYHALNTGRMARVVVDCNGERVEFVAANRTGLYNYIKQLEQELATSCNTGVVRPNNGPAQFLF